MSLDDDLVPLSARLSTGNGEGGSSWGMGGEEYARAKPLLQFAENGYSGS